MNAVFRIFKIGSRVNVVWNWDHGCYFLLPDIVLSLLVTQA